MITNVKANGKELERGKETGAGYISIIGGPNGYAILKANAVSKGGFVTE
jgi:hypothetical protein